MRLGFGITCRGCDTYGRRLVIRSIDSVLFVYLQRRVRPEDVEGVLIVVEVELWVWGRRVGVIGTSLGFILFVIEIIGQRLLVTIIAVSDLVL